MIEIFDFTSIGLTSDKYNGVTINSATIPDDIYEFEKELLIIIRNLKNTNLLWITLRIEKSYLIEILTNCGFIFHHCSSNEITMLKKLIKNSIIPTAINHTLGVGAVVIVDNKLLVIKDRISKQYKLPGGYIDDRENITQAFKREVFEETGIKVELDSIVSLGHFYPAQFEKSNLHIICTGKALSKEINILDTHEIIEAKWMDINEYFACEDIHLYNKDIVRSAIIKKGLKLKVYDYFLRENNLYEYFF